MNKLLHEEVNISYLPSPNISQIFSSNDTSPLNLTTATFMFAFDEDGVWLARNRRRGIEISGGHVEPGESLEEAVVREEYEEVGIVVKNPLPLAFQKLTILGDAVKPDGYKYPFPISYMQYWIGQVSEVHTYNNNDECLQPVRIGISPDGQYSFKNEDEKAAFEELMENNAIFRTLFKAAIEKNRLENKTCYKI